jgi:peptidoglycan/LPS O-acetylase OafA/YrhL
MFKISLRKLFSNDISLPESLKPNHLPGLDGLRAIAIIIVLLSHYNINTPYKSTFAGDTGVEIFFVLSGFLITSLLLKEKVKTGSISLKMFYFRRFLRILPLAYLYILVVIILNYYYSLNISLKSFFSASFFFQNIPKLSSYNWYVQHYWSLSVEEQFYLTFPFLLVYDLNKYIKITIAMITIVPIVSFLGFSKTGIFYTNPSIHIVTFILVNLLSKTVSILIGSITSILLFKGVIRVNKNGTNKYLSFIIFLLAIGIHSESSPIFVPYSGLLVFPILIATVIVLNLDASGLLTKFLNNPILVYIGLISYSIYIWQQLFTDPTHKLVNVPILINVILIFSVASVSYFLYEKRFTRLKEQFKRV